jgi:excisionase family DNA binding protein
MTNDKSEKRFYRPDEVAKLLSISRRTVYRMTNDGRLQGVKWGNGPWRITAESISKLMGE